MTHPALVALLRALEARGHCFVTPTPATHARVVARASRREACSIADVFGWSLPFGKGVLDPELQDLLNAAGALVLVADGRWRSALRASTVHGRLFLHSAYPTDAADSVFLGPDSYRFADLIVAELTECPAGARIVDIGTGAGVGAVVTAGRCAGAEVIMTDINPAALRLAAANAEAAGVVARPLLGPTLAGVNGAIDIALANPPFIADDAGRVYRDGGAMHGGAVALDMARAAVKRLAPGGRLILYTGSAICHGGDRLRDALAALAADAGCALHYRELDPDVFGEELDRPAYAEVDRIALVAAIVTRPA